MSFAGIKKSPLISIPFLKKRLRCITAIGLRNLTVKEMNFTIYFTLHRNDKTVAFYTSEPIENQRNPEWSYFKFPASTECLQDFVMRVWIISSNDCHVFLFYDIHLDDSLIPDEQNDDAYWAHNTLWMEIFGYHFVDKTSLTQLNQSESSIADKQSKRIQLVKSYNKQSILRMISVIEAVRNEKQSSVQCLGRIETFANMHESYFSKIKQRESHQLHVESLRQCLESRRIATEKHSNSNQQKQLQLQTRKAQLERNLFELCHLQNKLSVTASRINRSKCTLQDLITLVNFRQKEIIRDIYHFIYPIVSNNNNDEYSIANMKLPPAEDKIYHTSLIREHAYEIEAAVEHCAHFVCIISQFIQLPLRFPIEFYGVSPIKIHDHALQRSDFLLCPIEDLKTFQYGLYLLNRDIGQIVHHCHMSGGRIDYRKTLKNLKELLDKCFTNSMDRSQNQLYASNLQLVEVMNSINSSADGQRLQQDASNNSLLVTSLSKVSSFNESTNSDHDLNDNNADLFPTANATSPRLAMQVSQQP